MNEDEARELYESHKWYDESLQEMAARIVANWPRAQARTNAVRAIIALDHETHVVELQAQRASWQRQSEDSLHRVREIDAKIAALRGKS